MNLNFHIIYGDLLLEAADAIVNPANPKLSHGGGLSGAIYDAIKQTGDDNYVQFMQYITDIPVVNHERCATGKAVWTPAPGLKYKGIIHTVGPVANDYNKNELKTD